MTRDPSHDAIIRRVRQGDDTYTEVVHAVAHNQCRAPDCLCFGTRACLGPAREMVEHLILAGYEDALRQMRVATKALKR